MAQIQNKVPGRNENCWCGSGLKYKHCHWELDPVHGIDRVLSARKLYARQWSRNADNLAKQDLYHWCAARLGPYRPNRILDVGSGVGQGVAALWSNFQCDFLVSLDENYECLTATQRLLHHLGISATVVRRLRVEVQTDKDYFLSIETNKLTANTGLVLVESDILADPDLEAFLGSTPPFDAVTVWFVGTHLVRTNCLNLIPFQIKTPSDYRLRVQNKAYELADSILRPGGVLQVVDRSRTPTTEQLRTVILEGHREQASVSGLQVVSLEYVSYKERLFSKTSG